MVKQLKVTFRLNEEQKKVLEAKARAEGYSKVAFYIRVKLFKPISTEEKIDAIYKEICRKQ